MRIEAGVTQEMGISFQQALGVHPQAVKLRLERTELLTANLANVDTPNFKAKDIDFAREMQRANNAAVDVQYRVPMQPSEDGNTVELNRAIGYGVSLLPAIPAAVLTIRSHKNLDNLVENHNGKSIDLTLSFGTTNNGVGLVLKF